MVKKIDNLKKKIEFGGHGTADIILTFEITRAELI